MDLAGPKPTDTWLSYVAGYVDGEGCFHGPVDGRGIEVSISNTFPRVLEEIREVFGGRVKGWQRERGHHRPHFTLRLHGETARSFCQSLLPFLKEKKEQAELLLEFSDWPPRSAMREQIKRRLKEAKKRVYKATH